MKNPRSCWNGFCILLLMLCFALTGTSVAQNQYYIAPTGSDSNDGSKAHPWATINHANAALTLGPGGSCVSATNWEAAKGVSTTGVGACIHVASGTYAGAITTSKSGTASARIRYVSDTQYGAKLTGAGPIWSNYASYTDMAGFEFDGSVNAPHIALVNYFDSVSHACNNLFVQNKVHDITPAGGGTNSPGAVETAGTNLNPTSSCGNSYQANLFYHNNGGAGSTFGAGNGDSALETGWGDIVQNNIIMDQGGGMCVSLTHTSRNLIFTNNILLNCAPGGLIFGNGNGVNDFSTIANNVIVNGGTIASGPGIRVYIGGGCGTHNVFSNNLIYGFVGGNYVFDCGGPGINTFSGSNSTTFVNYTGTISGDYHLKAGSSAIGTGTTSCALTGCVPSTDFAGNARLQPLDIGSYAFTVTGAPAAPSGLTASVQ